MKKLKLFLLPTLALALIASLVVGIAAANFGSKTKVNAEGTITVYVQLDANADMYKEFVKINCNDGGEWWALVEMEYDDVAEMYKAEIDAKTTRVQLSFKSDWWTSFVESNVANNSIFDVDGNDLYFIGTYVPPEVGTKVSVNVSDYSALVGTLGDDIVSGVFTLQSGAQIRSRSKSWTRTMHEGYDYLDNYNTIDGEFYRSFTYSLKLTSSAGLSINAPGAGRAAVYLQNGSSSTEEQKITLNGTQFTFPGKSEDHPVVQFCFDIEADTDYVIKSVSGTVDIFYAECVYQEIAFEPDEDAYYLVGEFDGEDRWAFSRDSVKMVARAGNLGAAYKLSLKEGDKFKVRKGDGKGDSGWYQWDQDDAANKELVTFDGDANGVVKADGVYNVYLGENGKIYIGNVITTLNADEFETGTQYTETTEIEGTIFTFAAGGGKNVTVQENEASIDGVNFSKRFSLGGSANNVSFNAPFTGVVKFYAYGNSRTLIFNGDESKSVNGNQLIVYEVTGGTKYTLSGKSGGFSIYSIRFVDADTYAAEQAAAAKAATIADGIAQMAAKPGWYVLGKINGGTGDDEIDFAFSTYRGITMATGDNTAEYWGIELKAGDEIKFAYCDGEGHVTYTAGDNAAIAEDGTYNVYCYTGYDSQKYTSAAKVEREDFGIEGLVSKTSVDSQYIVFAAGITLDKSAAYEGYYIGMCINGTSYGSQKYYTAVSLNTESDPVLYTVDQLFASSNAMIVTEIAFAEVDEVIVYVYNGTTIVDSARYAK